jgi:hypothetical protein
MIPFGLGPAAKLSCADRDEYFHNVTLLVSGRGANGSTTNPDYSKNARTITSNNGAAISTTQSKFGGSSMFFDGSNDYWETPNIADARFVSGELGSIEWWVRPANVSAVQGMICQRDGGANTGWELLVNSDATWYIQANTGSPTFLISSSTLTIDTWHHLKMVRTGSGHTTHLYQDNVLVASGTPGISSNTGTALRLGRRAAAATNYFSGYMSDVRITSGLQLRPSTAAVPVTPYSRQP